MAEESTTVTPQNTVTRAVEAARSPKTSLKFPNNLGETGSELHSYIEFIVVKESNAREEAIKRIESAMDSAQETLARGVNTVTSSVGLGNLVDTSTTTEQKPADPTTTKINTRVEADSTIRLFIPENLQTPTAAQYDSQTMGTIGAAMTNFVGGSFGDLKDVGAGGNLGQSAISEVVQTAGNLLGGGGGDVINQAVFGRAANAAKYLLFKGIDFRKFQFQYNFVPRNIQESQDLEKIIKIFRQAMLSDIVSVGFYDIPQEFEIQYVIQKLDANGKLAKAPVLHRFKKCNLEECNVTYGSNGRFTLTRDGYPANIQLSLTFSENEQVTRKDIPEGF